MPWAVLKQPFRASFRRNFKSEKSLTTRHSICISDWQGCEVWYIRQFLEIKALNTEVLNNQLAEANATLDKAARDFDKAVIRSPVDGIVLKRMQSDERVLPAGELLLELADISQLELTADILSQDVAAVRIGCPVEISGSALLGHAMRGKVSRIKPEGFTKVSSLGVEEQRVPVVIAFDKAELDALGAKGCQLSVGYRLPDLSGLYRDA